MSRPELPEAEYRVRQWVEQWLALGDGYAGKVLRRLVVEYDDRGQRLGMPASARVLAPPGDTPAAAEPCHDGRARLQCARCQSVIEAAVDALAAAADRGSA